MLMLPSHVMSPFVPLLFRMPFRHRRPAPPGTHMIFPHRSGFLSFRGRALPGLAIRARRSVCPCGLDHERPPSACEVGREPQHSGTTGSALFRSHSPNLEVSSCRSHTACSCYLNLDVSSCRSHTACSCYLPMSCLPSFPSSSACRFDTGDLLRRAHT